MCRNYLNSETDWQNDRPKWIASEIVKPGKSRVATEHPSLLYSVATMLAKRMKIYRLDTGIERWPPTCSFPIKRSLPLRTRGAQGRANRQSPGANRRAEPPTGGRSSGPCRTFHCRTADAPTSGGQTNAQLANERRQQDLAAWPRQRSLHQALKLT